MLERLLLASGVGTFCSLMRSDCFRGQCGSGEPAFWLVIKRIFSGVGGKKSGEREEKRGRGRRGEEQRRMV